MKMFRKTWNRLSRRNKVILLACIAAECIALAIIIFGDTLRYAQPVAAPVKILIIAGLIGIGYCSLMWQDAYREVEIEAKVESGECPECKYPLQYVEAKGELACTECGWFKSKQKPVVKWYLPVSSVGETLAVLAIMSLAYWFQGAIVQGFWVSTLWFGGMLALGIIIYAVRKYKRRQ